MFVKATEVFRRIEEPDEVNTLLLFNACAQLRTKEALDLVKDVASKMPSSFHPHSNLITSLCDALIRCGDVEHAENVFRRSNMKDQGLYSVMMKGERS